MSTNNSGTDVSFSTRDKLVINRKHKDRIFRMLFSAEHKDYLLSLYNALHGTNYDNPDDLTITTLEDALFMGMKNDVSFIIDQHAALFEHQSTRNPNMPLRGFIYMARVLQSIIDMDSLDIYSNRLVEIPTPEYYVFYNGQEDCPETEDLYLSDAFKHKLYGHYEGHDRNSDGPFFECRARVININYGHNEEILKACDILNQYAQFVAMVRTLQKGYNENEEVIKKDILGVIDECIEKDILSDFLRKYRAEVAMSILTEFDVEKWKKTMREDGYYEGKADGLAEGRAEGRAEGKAEGRAEGKAEGKAEGRAEGKAEGMFLAAWKSFELKLMTAEQAAAIAGLDVETFLEKGKDVSNG